MKKCYVCNTTHNRKSKFCSRRCNEWYKKNLRKKSLSTLYRIRKAEKESEGTFCWYMYPCNIKYILDKLMKEKLKFKP